MKIPENVVVVLHEDSFTVWVSDRWYNFHTGWYQVEEDIIHAVAWAMHRAATTPFNGETPPRTLALIKDEFKAKSSTMKIRIFDSWRTKEINEYIKDLKLKYEYVEDNMFIQFEIANEHLSTFLRTFPHKIWKMEKDVLTQHDDV